MMQGVNRGSGARILHWGHAQLPRPLGLRRVEVPQLPSSFRHQRSDRRRGVFRAPASSSELRSGAELFVEELMKEETPPSGPANLEELRSQVAELQNAVDGIQEEVDTLIRTSFEGLTFLVEQGEAERRQESEGGEGMEDNGIGAMEVSERESGSLQLTVTGSITEADFSALGRCHPQVMSALLEAKEAADAEGWKAFQKQIHLLRLRRSEKVTAKEAAESDIFAAELAAAQQQAEAVDEQLERTVVRKELSEGVKIVLMTGFEAFNVGLYRQAAKIFQRSYPGCSVQVFSDRDLASSQQQVAAALDGADVFFGSLLFDFDQVEWLKERIKAVPTCLVFESALELMSCTQAGTFQMAPSGRRAGPPPAVKKVLSLFGSGREEDRMVGYLSFLKLGPRLLKFIPGERARDLRNWLTIYGYWNQGGQQNVLNMFQYIVDQYCAPLGSTPAPPVETPATGCLHPNLSGYFDKPVEYLRWYRKRGPVKAPDAPVVAVLLYRKHVITQQPYIRQLITLMEGQCVVPLPIFINGVEAHTIVRDQLTSAHEQRRLRAGDRSAGFTPKADAVEVDAVVNTIGFPLVGGPAGSMEAGRQADIAKAILASKNVPYVVAAPLLIQDLTSWTQDGIAGLQSVVLYSLPELDGAIDTVVLGGLVGNDIFLIPERVKRLCSRINRWVGLRRSRPCDRRIAVLLYGFPPGVGATGTAALLNVPQSVEALLTALRDQGYDLGADVPSDLVGAGEAIVSSLKMQEDQRFVLRAGRAPGSQGGMMDCGPAAAFGARVVAKEVLPAELKDMLTFPRDWGPSEWGPIPFLPDADILVRRMERQWGDLRRHRGINTTACGGLLVSGVQLGNVFIGVQPLLGIEGDPMRMLFERDLTPHPQYAAFYRWLEADWGAQAVVHFGMHGTVEWLPGSPLGNSGFSWSDVLLSSMPNVYLYACNNPSESVIAKRRGYGTIVSHNVPPYGRAGLYKQLAELKALLSEYREDPEANDSLRPAILDVLDRAGLQEDCPFVPEGSQDVLQLDESNIGGIALAEFAGYGGRLYQYLQVLENRIFSEGLHVLGRAPEPAQMQQYLDAYFEGTLPPAATSVLADASADVDAARQKLEQLIRKEATSPFESEKVEEAVRIRELLKKNSEEVQGVLRALNGEFILPEAGGDLLRDGAGVLPTGRNIHALDPYRMPSAAALERGAEAAEAILESHRQSNGGQLPETVAVNLWGLDAIKTKGESVAMALYLLGAKPVQEGTGRIVRFELIPLQELGRPRIDVLCNMSGIFRDSFQNVVELLDDVFQRAAAAEGEDAEMNYVKKHAQSMESQGLANPAARLFSNPAGDFGSMVNERVGAGNWGGGDELGETWASRNAFSYGRGSERGTARPEVLQSLLKTTDRIVQEIDSVEYGLTDIQEYYANTGALKRAAETARGDGSKVGCSIVESFGKQVKPKELEEVLRVEYRSKLLNPKWAKAMAAQGSGGAFEISQRMTAMLGWGATVDFQEDWTWGQAAETYVQDQEMAQQLRAANPEAFRNLVGRMLEAHGRGMWNADPDVLQQLQNEYDRLEDQLEGIELAR